MSYLSSVKRVIKETRFGSQLLSMIPKSLLYSNVYVQVSRLYEWERQGKEEEIDLLLRRRMVETLQSALTYVPWYKKNVEIDLSRINIDNVYDMLLQFPYTDKKIVMENWDDFINQKYSSKSLRYGSTEGTTGQGVKIAQSYRDTIGEILFLEIELKAVGYDYLRSKILRIGLDALKKEDEYPISIKGNRCYVSPIHLNDKWLTEIYEKCFQYGPEIIHSYPSLLYQFARYIIDNDLPPIRPRGILLASDTFLYHHYLAFLKAFGDTKIYSIYGMSERVILGFSHVNNEDKSIGYQLNRFFGYGENYVNNDGNHEIIGTGYWMYAMPFIRYKTNDFGKIDDKGFIQHLDGRGNSYLTTKSGYKIAGISILSFENYVWDSIDSLQIIQRQPGHLNLRIIPKQNYTDEIGERILADLERTWPGLFNYTIERTTSLIKGRSLKANSIIVDL